MWISACVESAQAASRKALVGLRMAVSFSSTHEWMVRGWQSACVHSL